MTCGSHPCYLLTADFKCGTGLSGDLLNNHIESVIQKVNFTDFSLGKSGNILEMEEQSVEMNE